MLGRMSAPGCYIGGYSPGVQRQMTRGGDLAVWQSGAGDRDLVFVHGFQNDHTVWRPLVQRLDQDRYRFTCYDLLGCGASGAADGWERCTIDEYGADLTALCDVLEVDRPVVLGHSLGGAIILSAALAHPGRFAGIVLVAPASTTGLDFLRDEASFDALAHPTPEQQRALARTAFRRPPPEEALRELMAVIELASPEHIEGAARAMRAFTRQPDLLALDVPSLLVCGDRDRHVPLRNHLATQQAIPRCGLQVYFDVGHVPFAETPDNCAADVERFLATIR
jgi:sigma-B regulation protein RsbQ